MPKTIALVTVHGMGDTEKDYYTDSYEALKKELDPGTWNRLLFKPLYYQDILQGNQREVFSRFQQIEWMNLRKFLLFGFSDAASLEYKKSAIGSPYFKTQEMILESMDEVYDEVGRREVPVVILAHSLGCQVISSYLWDATPGRWASAGVWSAPRNDGVATGSERDNFRRMRTLRRLYTTGCNIPIFVAGHEQIDAIEPPAAEFKWHNFFDKDDVLGWPLKPLSESYRAIVEDIAINAGNGLLDSVVKSWNPLSHGEYWSDRGVIRHLAASIQSLDSQALD